MPIVIRSIAEGSPENEVTWTDFGGGTWILNQERSSAAWFIWEKKAPPTGAAGRGDRAAGVTVTYEISWKRPWTTPSGSQSSSGLDASLSNLQGTWHTSGGDELFCDGTTVRRNGEIVQVAESGRRPSGAAS